MEKEGKFRLYIIRQKKSKGCVHFQSFRAKILAPGMASFWVGGTLENTMPLSTFFQMSITFFLLRLKIYVIPLSILFTMKKICGLVCLFPRNLWCFWPIHRFFEKKHKFTLNYYFLGKKSYFSFLNLFLRGDISVIFGALHTLRDRP